MVPKRHAIHIESEATTFTKKLCCLMFLDVRGYSQMTEPQLLSFGRIVLPDLAKICTNQKIAYINTWGDAIVVSTEDSKSLAVLATKLRDFFRSYDWADCQLPELSARISLHMGEIYFGSDAFSARGMIIGNAVNLAARVEPIVPPGQIWATGDFITALARSNSGLFRWAPVGNKILPKEAGTEELYTVYVRQEPNPNDKREVAVAVVVKDNKVLLVRRADSAEPVWQFPAGQVKPNGDPLKTAERECRKETGIECRLTKKIGERWHPNTEVYLHYFYGNWISGEIVNGDTYENDLIEWVSPAEAFKRFTTDILPDIRAILNALGENGT